MDRFRWYDIKFPLSFERFTAALVDFEYDESLGLGFSLKKVRKSSVVGVFVERKYSQFTVEDPFGVSKQESTINYVNIPFKLFKCDGGAVLEICNTARTLRRLVSCLSDVVGNDFSMTKVDIEVLELYKEIRDDARVIRVKVEKVVASSIQVSESAIATIELISQGDALAELNKIYSDKKFNLKKLLISARISGETEMCEIRYGGIVCCSTGFYDVVVSAIL